MPWTEERVTLLRELWMAGLSASQCASILGGVTRNAVISKVHRSGFPGRKNHGGHTTRKIRSLNVQARKKLREIYIPVATARIRAPVINPRKAALRADQIESLNVPLIEIQAFQCRAITDDTRFAQRCCGQHRDGDSPYCADHRVLYSAPAQGKAA